MAKKKATRKKAAVKKAAKKATRKKATRKKPAKRPAKKAMKKAAKKAAKKATGTKKRKTPKNSIEVYKLAEAPSEDRFFVLANGKPVRHVAHLAEVLEDLEDHVFHHHVSDVHNDFHQWVKDVFKDIQLAKKMLGVKDKQELQLVIYKHAAHKAFNR